MKHYLYPIWVLIEVLLLVSCLFLWLTAPEYRSLNLSLSFATFVLFLILIIPKVSKIKNWFLSQSGRYALNSLIQLFFIFFILGLINYWGRVLNFDYDFSQKKVNTLSDQTLQVIKLIKKPLKITLFANREEWRNYLPFLKLFENQTKLIELDAIDLKSSPQKASQYKITQSGTLHLAYGEIESTFVIQDELSMVNQLLKILRDKPLRLGLIQGHDEPNCEDTDSKGLASLCHDLKKLYVDISYVKLSEIQEIPKLDILLLIGPQSEFLPIEIDRLKNYLNKGGNFLMALHPVFEKDYLNDLRELLQNDGVILKNDLVVDRISTVQGSEATIPIVSNYNSDHPVTARFKQRTFFPLSHSVRTKDVDGIKVQSLAMSTDFPASWAESDLKTISSGSASYNKVEDLAGPIALVTSLEKITSKFEQRISIVGSSLFFENNYQAYGGNSQLAVNLISWLAFDDGLIALNRPTKSNDAVILSERHLTFVFVISVLLIPLLFSVWSALIYRKRRFL